MKINRCIHCMEEIGEGAAVCPHCRKMQEYLPGYDGLRPNTILHGRYLIGLFVEQDTYIAFDLAEGKRISVKEFFPRFQAAREGHAAVPCTPGKQWDKGLEEFLQLGNTLLQQPLDLNLPRVQEVFQENGTAYIALCDPVELPLGHSVYDLVKERNPTPEETEFEHRGIRGIFRRPKSNGVGYYLLGVQSVLRPTAKNLQWLHQNGFLHRQIEPSGIRWDGDVEHRFFRLPFPLLPSQARIYDCEGRSGPIWPTPFSPLEEFRQRKDIGPWTDVYSLCAVLYYYVTGQHPPDAVSRLEDGKRLPGLPADLTRSQRAVLEDGMALHPKDRIQSINELLRRADESLKSPGGFDPRQNMPQVVYGPPPQENNAPNVCPSCHFQWKSAVMLGKPGCCPHCGEKLTGGKK